MGECVSAFLTIGANLPECVTKIMDSSRIDLRNNL